MSRHLKQAIYGGFYILIFALLIWGLYASFFSSTPTCSDNRKNQNEEGVDCGGSCQKICLPPTIKEIKVSDVKIFPLREGRATLFGEISNPNPDYAIKNFAYSFKILEPNATSSESIVSGRSFVYPNGKTYLIFPNTNYQFSITDKPEITLTNLEWAKKENFEKPSLSIQDYEILETEDGIKVTGAITNDTLSNASEVRIFALFKNQFQKIIGASETILDLESKQTLDFSIFHPPIEGFRKELTIIDFSTLPNN